MTKRMFWLLLCLGLAGCSKLTADNYAKLQLGMGYAEVTAVLGPPQSCDDTMGIKRCRWGDGQRRVTVRFVADKLVLHEAENLN